MKELQKARAQCVRWVCILLLAAIIGFTVLFVAVEGIKSVKSWNELDFDEDINRIYAEDVVPDLYGNFMNTHSDGSNDVEEAYYILGIGNGKYMCISFKGEEIAKAKALMAAYEQYDNGEIAGEELESYYFTTQGRIRRLKDGNTVYAHMQAYVDWWSMTEEERNLFLFYELEAETVSYRNGEWIAFGCLIGFFIVLLIIIQIIVRGPFGKKALKKYIRKSGNSQLAREKVKNFFEHERVAPDLWLNKEFIGGLRDEKVIFGELKKLVWMYGTDEQEKHTISNAAYCINLHFEDGSKQQMMYNENLQQLFGFMEENCPWVILEYSDELRKLFYKDLPAFLGIQYYSTIKG